MATLDRAIILATEAHAGQTDKAGAPYILHPLHVMLAQTTTEARVVAVLHDVMEDSTNWGRSALEAAGFSAAVLDALEAVTVREHEKGSEEGYMRFVRRAAAHPIGRLVKLADLRDNADLSRIASPSAKDIARVEKYRRAIELMEALER